jgi:hypothetical protein
VGFGIDSGPHAARAFILTTSYQRISFYVYVLATYRHLHSRRLTALVLATSRSVHL